MAHLTKLPSGLWMAAINKRGVRRALTFETRAGAQAWATQQEAEIMSGIRGEISGTATVADLIDRYQREVTPNKKGRRWEDVRLDALKRDLLASVRLRYLDTPHVAAWQERRLKDVSGASVRRERNLLNAMFNIATKEWKAVRFNPFVGVRRPKDGQARERLATQAELDAVIAVVSPAMRRAITIAVETGMRAGEIASLRPENVRGRVAVLLDTKNGTRREVPLSTVAVEALVVPVGLPAGSISELWKRAAKQAGVVGLTFHDLRRTAIVRLSRRLNPFDLAKMVGHKSMNMTLNVYYKSDPEEIAKKLD